MRLLTITSVLVAGFSLPVFAQEATPQSPSSSPILDANTSSASYYLHQPSAGQFDLTPSLVLTQMKYEVEDGDMEYDMVSSLIGLGIGFDYGISDMFSIGANLNYGEGTVKVDECPSGFTCNDRDQGGLEDPSINAKLKLKAGPGAFRFMAKLSMATEDHKVKSNGDSNLASGGTTGNLQAGYEVKTELNAFGGLVGYDVYQSDRDAKSGDTKYKSEGGNNLNAAIFAEHASKNLIFGGALTYFLSAESKNKVNGTSAKAKDDFDIIALEGYMPIRAADNVLLTPKITLGKVKYKSSETVDDATVVMLGGEARFTF